MWYCEECNQENSGRFCVKCGKEYVKAAAEETTTGEQGGYAYEENENDAFGGGYKKSPKNAPKKSNKGLVIGIIVAAAVVVVLGIAAAVMVISADRGDKVSKDSTGIFYYVSGVEDYASLYEENRADSKELVRLKNGAPVEYLDESAPFIYVLDHSSGLYGYMRSDVLVKNIDDVVDAADDEKEDEDEEMTSLGDYYVTNTKNSLSLRDEAGSDGNVIAKLYNGYKLSLLEETTNKYWYVYDYNSGERGYVLKDYLTDDESKVQAATEMETAPASKTIVGTYYVSGTKNYLAIRSRPSSSSTVEIGKTYNGNSVGLVEKTNGTFWYIYDYASGLYGYVKCAYLSGSAPAVESTPTVSGADYIVSGTKNYLAIRSEPSPSETVEIGKTYNGNIIQVVERTNDTYWYIYDYSSGLYGFVKCAYLVQ